MQQASVNIDSNSKTTMTTIGQQSHIVNRVERAFRVISDRDKEILEQVNPSKFEQKKRRSYRGN